MFVLLSLCQYSIYGIAEVPRLTFSHLDAAPGSYSNLITALHKHSDGLLWIGTSCGLCRYDGYTVSPVTGGRGDTSILDDYINGIVEDCKGRLWLQTQSGFGIYDPLYDKLTEDFGRYVDTLGIAGDVRAMSAGNDGDIWISTEDGGLYRYGCSSDRAVKFDVGGLESKITGMVERRGELAVVAENGSLAWIDTKTRRIKREVPPSDIGRSYGDQDYLLVADNSDRYWIYSNEYLMVYDDRNGKWLDDMLPRGGAIGIMKCIFEDAAGHLWLARDHHGLELIETEADRFRFVSANPPGEISRNNTITCFLEDSLGTMWMGTYKRGLLSYNESVNKFSLEDFPDVNCLLNSGDDMMWVGTDSDGLWQWNTATGEKRALRDPADGFMSPAITSLAAAGDDGVYIGSFSKGLRKYADGQFKHLKTGCGLDASYVWSLGIAPDNAVWAGTLGNGLYRFDPAMNTVETFTETNSELPSDFVMSILPSRDKRIYIGTAYGVAVYEPKDGKLHQIGDIFPGIKTDNWKTLQIFEDSRGLLWVATSNGLLVIDRTNGILNKVDIGLSARSGYILGIIQDNGGALWVSEGGHLIKLKVIYNEKSGELSVSPHIYDTRDGLMKGDFNQRSFAKLSTGEIVVGGLYGLNRFFPAEIKYNTARPKVIFTDFYLRGVRIRPGEKADGRVVFPVNINHCGTVELSHNPKEFTVYFTTDNYALPEKTVYEYKLEGYNNIWMRCTQGVNHVTYTNLSAGNYRLMVRAINGDGYESDLPGVLDIHVCPPFWASSWAIVIYILLTFLLFFAIVKIIRRYERRRFERSLHEEEIQKREEINQLKFKFFTNVSHDLRTPLSLIVSPLEEMIKETTDERQSRRLSLMRSNAMRLLTLVNQLLDFRKNEVTGLQFTPTEGDVVAFCRNVCNSFVNFSERKNINLTFYSDRESINLMFDEDKLEKIFMNLLGNAFKFTPAGGRVDVSLEQVGEENPVLRIKIADTGIGIKDKDKEHIFERFYQVDDEGESHPHMGSGIGLSMVSEYVRLHDGTIRVTDNVDKGSVFIIDIPIRHFRNTGINEVKTGEPVEISVIQKKDFQADTSKCKPEIPQHDKGVERPVVMVVDDNPDMTEMLKFELEKDFDIMTASGGSEALRMIENVKPQIILTDLMMPGMDGIELCRRLKGDKSTVAIPIIILTAKHDLGVKLEGLTIGADDYITKPFNFDVLKLRMKRLVELTAKGVRRRLIEPEPEAIKITPLDEQFIEKAMKYVSDHLDSSELSVEELSGNLGMSRVRLYKKIKHITGKTPIEFIRVIRLKRAAQLLRESQLNVSEIAYRTGFNNPKTFSRYFKEEFGILPSVYQSKEGTETNYTV